MRLRDLFFETRLRGLFGRAGVGPEVRVQRICNRILDGLNYTPAAPASAGGLVEPSGGKDGERTDTHPKLGDGPTRPWLLLHMRQIMEIALDRVTNPKTPTGDRIKWSRVLISAGQACNSVLRDVDIEALKKEIQELRQLTEEKLRDEQGSDQEEHRPTPQTD